MILLQGSIVDAFAKLAEDANNYADDDVCAEAMERLKKIDVSCAEDTINAMDDVTNALLFRGYFRAASRLSVFVQQYRNLMQGVI